MLERLSVSNLAVVEKAEVRFAPGLNAITGETGAGKSVLIGALDLVLGSRAAPSQVRDGAREATATAQFDLSGRTLKAVSAILEDAGLPPCEDGALFLRRTVYAAQGAKAWVNDSPATAAVLRRLAPLLVDIHGPRSNQRILEERFQRETLDSYGGTPFGDYARDWSALCEIRDSISALEGVDGSDDEADLLRYQVGELEAASLSPDDDEIAARHKAAADAGAILADAEAISQALDGEGGASETLFRAQSVTASLSRRFPKASEWMPEIEDVLLRIRELSRTVADAMSSVSAEPEDLEALDARLTLLNGLKRKYLKDRDAPVSALVAALESKRERLARLEGRDVELERLAAKEKEALANVVSAGGRLSSSRKKAAAKLSAAVTRELKDLGFLHAKFSIEIASKPPAADGCDTIVFMFEPNPGESPRPLGDIASSGETARAMLALKGVLAAHDSVDTLVFDEIDANIGGETGRIVGEKMHDLSRFRQVVAITHLPQSAAFADSHLVVSKTVSGGRTRTGVDTVEGEELLDEMARMLGGEDGTPSARAHAGELLSLAQDYKSKRRR